MDCSEDIEKSAEEKNSTSLPWYHNGLKFKCSECGKCCTGSSGFVWITEEEIITLAASLNMSVELFSRKYLRKRANRYALVERKKQNGDFDCVFLDGKKCSVYENRPKQCRTFPWWPQNLNSEESWRLAANECEGINDEAPLVPYPEILQMLQSNDY